MKQNSLQKGDVLSVSIRNENLVLHPKTTQKEMDQKESQINIKVDDKSIKHIDKEIISAYINNYRTIVLEGENILKDFKNIQRLIHNLIALEVMEQSPNRIVAKDFLNMNDINVKNIIQKMDTIARAMLQDAEKTFDENNYENIRQRDNDVNRLFFLACRAIKFGLRNPLTVSQLFQISSGEELLNYRLASTYIEKISDTAKRAARYMGLIKFNQKQKKEFIKIFNKIENQYIEMMDAYYKNDAAKALRLCDNKEEILGLCDEFYKKNKSLDWIGFLITQMKNMLIRVYSIGRVVYQ